ncbi:MAG: PD-(D/E)XK nuclease family protein [Acidimicrobiales bacterium]
MTDVEVPLPEPDATPGTFERKPQLNAAQAEIMDRLRFRSEDQMTFEPGFRAELRLELERGLAPLVERLGDDDLYLSKHKLEQVHGCEGKFLAEEELDFAWSAPIARGIVAHRAIEIAVTSQRQWTPLDLVDEAIARLQNEGRGIGEWLQTATEADIDTVRADANNAVCNFQDCWPVLDRRWRPATEVSMRAEFFEGRIVLSGKPDLTIGRPDGLVARKVIVDFKTGRISPAHVADLRFYALLDALRLGVPPRLLVSYYLDAGQLQAEPVNEGILDATVRRTVGAAERIVALRSGEREPRLVPSGACSWCPALADCATGRAFLDDRSDRIGDPDANDLDEIDV